jgi:hypothetical protein
MPNVRRLNTLVMLTSCAAIAACASGSSRTSTPAKSFASASRAGDPNLPGLVAITRADLERDLYALTGDGMRGREGGNSLDELRASMWLADRAREAGIEPAGEDGSYFQFFNVERLRQSSHSSAQLGGTTLRLGDDAVTLAPVDAHIDAPLLFVEPGSTPAAADVRGRVVATALVLPASLNGVAPRRYGGGAVRQLANKFIEQGAIAVVIASDSLAEASFAESVSGLTRGRNGVDTLGTVSYWPDRQGGPARAGATQAPVIWTRRALLEQFRAPNQRFVANLTTEQFTFPSVNIVGRIRGTDAKLRDEYVLYSGHQDHDGVRVPIAGDSIWNGADDNGTVSVAMLAIGRAFSRAPGKRSTLFVWHGSEERGLLGSRYHVMHPMVPKSAIVAVINGDMIGRNHPDSATVLGIQPPHRNSASLIATTLAANAGLTKFHLDSIWDRPSHPEGWYFRSDHLPYARVGIPAISFSTNLHPDYHTPRDEPSRIDYAKLTRMTQWMYATGWAVSNAAERPSLDAGFKLER